VPLHSAPAGLARGRAGGDLPVTTDLADRLLRLPLWLGLEEHQPRVIERIAEVLGAMGTSTAR
jgi:dTDP-4-amino-4,6-dideoxygalactose transaminase